MTILVNRFSAPAGKEAGLQELVKGWSDFVSQAEGCNSFTVYTDLDTPSDVVTIEDWDSREAHEAFRSQIPEDTMQEAMEFMTGMPVATYLNQA